MSRRRPVHQARARTALLAAVVVGWSSLLGSCAAVDDLVGGEAHCAADYPYYSDASALVEASDLIVVAVPGEQEVKTIDIGAGTFEAMKVWPLEVERVISGDLPTEHPLEVKLMDCLGAPGLAEGSRHVLFLATYPDTPGMPASLLNPEQGQYLLGETEGLVPVGDNEVAVQLNEVERLAAG